MHALCWNCGAPMSIAPVGEVRRCEFCNAESRIDARATSNVTPIAKTVTPESVVTARDGPELFARYVATLQTYVRNEPSDEALMRCIEDEIDIPDARRDEFRREIMTYAEALATAGGKLEWTTNARLKKAVELALERRKG